MALGGAALAVTALATPAMAGDVSTAAPKFHGFNHINLNPGGGQFSYDAHHTGCINLIGFDNIMSSMRLEHTIQLWDGLACKGDAQVFGVGEHRNLHERGWGDRASSFIFVG